MFKSLIFFILTFWCLSVIGQSIVLVDEGQVVPIEEIDETKIVLSFDKIGMTSIHLNGPKGGLSEGHYLYGDIVVPMHPDPHTDDSNSDSYLLIVPDGYSEVEIIMKTKAIKSIWSYRIYKDKSRSLSSNTLVAPQARNMDCACDPVTYIDRVGWGCPWGEDSTVFIPTFNELTHIVIHHQGGAAVAPYDGTVRAIWNHHVNNNGWSDIGYHWLVDPDGMIYKGRAWLEGDENVQGAHMCACNSNKMGICLLGDFTASGPSLAQRLALADLIAIKGCELQIPPIEIARGTTRSSGTCIEDELYHVIGHKDGCPPSYTVCPGDSFYPDLPQVIEDAQAIYKACTETTSVHGHLQNEVSLYPNPTFDDVTVVGLAENSLLILYDLGGNPVSSYRSTSSLQHIALPPSSGFYLLQVMNSTSSFYFKIVKN